MLNVSQNLEIRNLEKSSESSSSNKASRCEDVKLAELDASVVRYLIFSSLEFIFAQLSKSKSYS